MAYPDDVRSQSDGDGIELYLFEGPQVKYTHTSGTRSVSISLPPGGPADVYTPLAGLKRSARGSSSSADKTALTVTMTGACDLVRDYGYGTPPRSLRLRVWELQRTSGTVALVWDGDAVACEPNGVMAEFRSTSQLAERMATPVPGVSFQSLCNHFLYDARCRVDRNAAGHHHEPAVVAVDRYTITVDSIGLFPDQWFRAGEIVRDSDGERRTIVDQVGAVLMVSAPFRELDPTDAVTLYAGCAHTVSACSDKFNNVANFGGHPSMPNSNPFIVNIRLLKV